MSTCVCIGVAGRRIPNTSCPHHGASDKAGLERLSDRPMPLHNLLVHVAGYANKGCAACDWLRERGHIPPATSPEEGR